MAFQSEKDQVLLIRNGETDEYDWKGFVPFDQLPFSFNPENGYVSSANNKTVDDSYPYYISASFCTSIQNKQDQTDAK